LDYRKWILIFLITVFSGCGAAYPDPSGTVVDDHGQRINQTTNSVLPPKYTMGDIVSVEEDVTIGIIVKSDRETVEESEVWVYSVLFHNKTIRYSEDKIVLVEKFDWNRPAKKGVID